MVSLVSRPFDYIKIGHWSHLGQWSCVSSNLVSLGRVNLHLYCGTLMAASMLCLSIRCTFPLETSVLLKSVVLVNFQGSQCVKPSGASRAKKVSVKYINLEAQVVLTAKCVRPNTYYYVHTIYKSNHSKYRAPTYICETNSNHMYWQLSCSHSSIGPQCSPILCITAVCWSDTYMSFLICALTTATRHRGSLQ